MTWQLALELTEHDEHTPLFARIAQAIARDIARGRLRPGQRLPGARSLAASLGVNRNTVTAALGELASQGWIETRPARGSFVREPDMACARPQPLARYLAPRTDLPRRVAFAIPAATAEERWYPGRSGVLTRVAPTARLANQPHCNPDALVLSGGMPDARLFPGNLLARAYRRVVTRRADVLLDYGDPQGYGRLRAALAEMLADRRGLATGPDDIAITRGSQMAMWLIGQTLIRPGDRVAVESYGYVPAWDALRAHGAELCPIPVDQHGARIDELEALLATTELRAVYLTPHHQFPTMAVLSAQRRLRLLALARAHRFAIIEDDYDNEYHYEGRPILPLASADRAGSVIYIGTLSKVLAPGLRIGYVVAPRPFLRKLVHARIFIDRQGDTATEAAVAELLEDGEVERHIRRTRRIYHARRDALAELLDRHLGGHVQFTRPRGGMALWVHVDRAIDVTAWAERARARGVIFTPGRMVAFDGRRRHNARIGFARADRQELARAVATLKSSLP